MPDPLRILLFGAGNRGADAYGAYALQHPDEVTFVAVAEPNKIRRERFAQVHHIPNNRQFLRWQDALAAGSIADAVINATQDEMHHPSALAAMAAGYDQLLEKPIAPTLAETLEIVKTAEKSGRLLMICHVLRYTDFFQQVKQVIQSGALGQAIHIAHNENVSYYHMAHSYVRGNWRNTTISAPMILTKCCHDLDLLCWFLDEKPARLGSVGGLLHYRAENAPAGAPERCLEGCPAAEDCPFYAPRIYLESIPIKQAVYRSPRHLLKLAGYLSLYQPRLAGSLAKVIPPLKQLTAYSGWPRSTITDQPESDAAVLEALRYGPYGRCVYRCDNTVVDHQVVSLTFEGGVTANLTMHGHSHEEGRTLRIDGARATLLGKFTYSEAWLELHPHRPAPARRWTFPAEVEQTSGHGGGDAGLMRQFVEALRKGVPEGADLQESLESHLLAFAAEEARLGSQVVEMKQFRKSNLS